MSAKKILIVDFDQEFLKFLSQFLRNEGFTVLTAIDGAAGLEIHKSQAPDLVITEAMLPKLHGFELCSRISHSASRKTPVVIVTGVYRDTVYKTEAIHTFGASAYFEKPLDPDELMVSLRKILGLPEPAVQAADPIDAAIMEALVSETAAPPPPKKPEGKASVGDEVDSMLRSTLAEFGLKAGKKTATPQALPPKPQAPSPVTSAASPAKLPATPTEVLKPAPAPSPAPADRSAAKEPRRTAPKPALRSGPVRPEKRRPEEPVVPPSPKPVSAPKAVPQAVVPEAPPDWAPHAVLAPPSPPVRPPVAYAPSFGEFLEPKKKSVPPRVFGAIAGVLILTSATIFVLKPGKKAVPAEQSVPAVAEEVQQGPGQIPSAVDPSATAASIPESPDRKSAGPAPVRSDPKPAPSAPADKPVPKPEDIKPLVPETTPSLEIQAPETVPATSGAAPADAEGEAARAAADAPIEIPAAKIKAGDVVPLDEADVPPRQVRTADPVYPSAARSLGREGSIVINILISETGDVIQTAVIGGARGSLGFDKAAESAVRKWKFTPAVKDGVPVRVWKSVTIAFKLKK